LIAILLLNNTSLSNPIRTKNSAKNTSAIEKIFTLNSNIDVPVYLFPNNSEKLIIWLPSEYGFNITALTPTAKKLQQRGYEVWLADLKTAYFAPRGRTGIKQFKVKDSYNLISLGIKRKKTKIYLLSSSLGAIHALDLAQHWQQKTKSQQNLRGLILLSPALYSARPQLGEEAQFHRAAYLTNLSTFILQPEYSSFSRHGQQLVETLSKGGSHVFFQYLTKIKDGFHAKPISTLNKHDLLAKNKLADWIANAVKSIEFYPIPKQASTYQVNVKPQINALAGLREIKNSHNNLTFEIQSIKNKLVRLSDFKNQVVLVSFWASWCPPCIKELPSLNRLQTQFKAQGLKIITINMGESKATINNFLKKNKITATVLMDSDTKVSKKWNVYTVPSNFILDRKGTLRFGSVGAIDWDEQSTRKIISDLLKKKRKNNK